MATFKKLSIIRQNLLGSDSEKNEGVLLNEVFYNEDGHEIERFNYNSDGELEEHIITEVIEGRPVNETLEINGEVTERTTRVFDQEGRLISESRFYLEGGTDTITYEYDGENLLLRKVVDEEGEEGEKEIREYKDGKIIKESHFDIFGNLEIEKDYEYHENNTISEITEISYRGDLPEKNISVFDESGKMIIEKKYDSKERLIARTTIKYNESNLPLIFEEESTRGKKTTALEYDNSGNNTRQEEADGDGKRISLIERTYSESGQPLTAEVIMEPTMYHAGQHYRLEYIYASE
ncbi:MAG TPA: hypothetical protein VK212_00545 [Lentimicrobium sp.]|nr:hypothetical protein [Lentimicrobium sp.]